MATIAHIKDPFRPQLNPVLYELDKPKTVQRLLFEQGMIDRQGTRKSAFVVCVDGDYILQADWGEVIKPGSCVAVIELPPYLKGGGNGGSNPLRLVLQVALIVASYYFPPAMGLTGWAAGAAQAAIMIGGTMLINALLPTAQNNSSNDGKQAKQSYFLGSQQNSIEKGAPIQVWYGRRRVYPALAAQPYIEISGNEVYLHQLMCLTQGKVSIEQICIEKTLIDNFDEVEYQVIEPNGLVTLFPDNVYTAPEVQDFTLDGFNEDGPSSVVGYKKAISYAKNSDDTFTKSTTYTPVNGKLTWKGGYIVTPLGVTTQRIAVDISLPRGLAYMNNEGNPESRSVGFLVQAREIDDSNQPVGDWFFLSNDSTPIIPNNTTEVVTSNAMPKTEIISAGITISGATIDPIMQSYYFTMPSGRYELRVARTTDDSDASRVSDEIHWIGARSYMPAKRQYGNVTMLAVKMKATNNLNNNISRRINVLGTRILPVFNGTDWTEQATRSIAWAAADILRNTEYGRGLKLSRINLQELQRLDAVWSSRSDHFDGYFNTETNVWDALTRCTEVGRTKPVYVAGVIDFVRNEPKTLPTQMFTPENMVQDSFNVRYAFQKTGDADHVIVQYTDPTSWDVAEVVCALPDSPKLKAATLDMTAITSRQQAWREGIHRAAMNQVQREFPSWQTEMEGLALGYGSVVLAAHDVPEWGSSGRIVSVNGNVIECSDELPWSENNVIALRGRNGDVQGTYPITRIDEFTGRITGTPYISNGYSEEPTHYIFGNTERIGKKLVVTGVVPDADNKVTVSAVVYSDYPHMVETTETMPLPELPVGDDYAENLQITWLRVKKTLAANEFTVTSNQARGASRYQFEVSPNANGAWSALHDGSSPVFTGALPYGSNVRIRARAIGSHTGSWHTWQGIVSEEITEPLAAPVMNVTQTDVATGLRTFDITITASEDLPRASSYVVTLDGVVIWSGVLGAEQSAALSKTFQRQVDDDSNSPTHGQYIDTTTAVFEAYGYAATGQKTLISSQTVSY